MGNWRQGLKIDLGGNKAAGQYSLTSHKNFAQNFTSSYPTILFKQRKNFYPAQP